MRKIKDRFRKKLGRTISPIPDPSKFEGRFFIIHSMPRTASTSLRTWLNQQDGMLCHGEVLGPNKVHGTSNKQAEKFEMGRRNRHPYGFARTYFADHEHRLLGFKALSSHLLDHRNLAFVRWFFDAKPMAIMLYRDDLVARYKSSLYHRLHLGHVSEKYILALKPKDVIADCVSIREQWLMANRYWTSQCESIFINIKDLSGDIRPDLENLLGTKIEGALPRSNAKSSQKAKSDHEDLVAHVEKICARPQLDRFRAVDFDL